MMSSGMLTSLTLISFDVMALQSNEPEPGIPPSRHFSPFCLASSPTAHTSSTSSYYAIFTRACGDSRPKTELKMTVLFSSLAAVGSNEMLCTRWLKCTVDFILSPAVLMSLFSSPHSSPCPPLYVNAHTSVGSLCPPLHSHSPVQDPQACSFLYTHAILHNRTEGHRVLYHSR